METPKSGKSRPGSRLKLKRTRSTVSGIEAAAASPPVPPSMSAPCQTSTPSSKEVPTSNPQPEICKEDSYDDDDDDYLYQGTQFEDGRPEIIWVEEPSPRRTRALLRKKMDEAWSAAGGSDNELTPKQAKPKQPAVTMIMRGSRRQPSEAEKENVIKYQKTVKEMEEILNKMLEEEAAAAATAVVDKTPGEENQASSVTNDEEVVTTTEVTEEFCNSSDDSFLCRASQFVERSPAQILKNCQQTHLSKIKSDPRPPDIKEEEDPFADDMDSIFSQIDVTNLPQGVKEKSASVVGTLVKPPPSGSKKLLQTGPPPPQQESGVKRRCNSAVVGMGTPPLLRKGAAPMPRCASSPDSHRPPGLPGGRPLVRCTQEEIEKKRQEALMRRKQKSQQNMSLMRKK